MQSITHLLQANIATLINTHLNGHNPEAHIHDMVQNRLRLPNRQTLTRYYLWSVDLHESILGEMIPEKTTYPRLNSKDRLVSSGLKRQAENAERGGEKVRV